MAKIYIDRLNLRWGVLQSIKKGLGREDYSDMRSMLYKCTTPAKYGEYSRQLKDKSREAASKFNLSGKLTFCF